MLWDEEELSGWFAYPVNVNRRKMAFCAILPPFPFWAFTCMYAGIASICQAWAKIEGYQMLRPETWTNRRPRRRRLPCRQVVFMRRPITHLAVL